MLKIKVDKKLNQLSYLEVNFDVFLITITKYQSKLSNQKIIKVYFRY